MIAEVTQALAQHLLAHTSDIGPGWIEIASLEAGAALTADRLQICLYAIDEEAQQQNRPIAGGHGGGERAPLGLRLHYVMHYSGLNHLEAQSRLTRVIQVFDSTPVLDPATLPPPLPAVVERLDIRLHQPTLQERNGLWSAFGRGLRLALYYEVNVSLILP